MTPSNSSRSLVQRLARGELQGYLSLSLTALLIATPFLRLPPTFELALGLAALFFALVFGIRGVRHPRGGGRAAAWLSMATLFVVMATSVALVVIDLGRGAGGSR